MFHRGELTLRRKVAAPTTSRSDVAAIVRASPAREGLATVFIHHTSASLIICENADPSVRHDLETFAARLVPDGDPLFTHDAEGDDDMPAHVRSVLTQTSIGIPIVGRQARARHVAGPLPVGAPHRAASARTVTVTVIG